MMGGPIILLVEKAEFCDPLTPRAPPFTDSIYPLNLLMF